MIRLNAFFLIVIVSSYHALAQEAEPPGRDRALKPTGVQFKPPSDLIKTNSVELTDTEEFHRLTIPRMQSGKEKVIGVPLKNISDKKITVKNIEVSCGCMAAIANSLEINTKETLLVYLRITPTEVGRFAKRVTISFEGSPAVTCVIESIVAAAFNVSPNAMLLEPGDVQGGELVVKSVFDYSGFEVKSLNPFMKLVYDRQEKEKGNIYRCELVEGVKDVKAPAELMVPIQVKYLGKIHEYSLQVINSASVAVKPSIVFARRNAQDDNQTEFFVVVRSWREVNDLTCEIASPANGLSLKEIRRKSLSGDALLQAVTFVIEGDTQSTEEVTINWIRDGEIVGTCRVFTNGRSDLAQETFRELNRERNRQLIEQGKANALDPLE
ncbi:DUF1573 domain-containing protein [Stieleria sp. TO1_6]|uniref:DUF1573 domain-containing protein n=1 Tax=Stieleria tagensis TaxID=2956795 RepID=UPI00209A7BEF|nr:DUF1573 domain-containing protein [Stieleria tagensis]MCO8121701.1 DUF1573 domain-containing protein [Stieleria tagensis]